MTNAAMYIRVSTHDKGQCYDNQKPAIEQYAQSRGYEIVKEYAEEASAWKSGHQKELSRLYKDASDGQFSVLLVWALDRLSREGATKILTIVKKFKDAGVQIISVTETWTEAPGVAADLLYAVMGWVAEMESRRQSERTKAGIERRKQSGGHAGRKVGSKDKRKRRVDGYKDREARKRLERSASEAI